MSNAKPIAPAGAGTNASAASEAVGAAAAMEIQREVDRLRELRATVARHTTAAFKAMGRAAESIDALQAALKRIEAAPPAAPVGGLGPVPERHPILTIRDNYEFEVLDSLALWRAVRDRLRDVDEGDGISDATSLLLKAEHVHRHADTPPPPVVSLARASAALAGEYLASGGDTALYRSIRELADGMVALLEAVIR